MPALTVAERLAQIEDAGWPVAYDGCHKLYFLEDEGRERQAREFGYEIHPASALRDLYDGSCSLRFVTRWGYDNPDFEHEWNIDQFEQVA